MTYVVNDGCIRCKTMDCVAVCPVDCFYEGENMLGRAEFGDVRSEQSLRYLSVLR